MAWADRLIADLQAGRATQCRPVGQSMTPRIKSRQLVTIEPLSHRFDVTPDDIVLCRVSGREYLHLVLATANVKGKRRYLIGNNHGRVNGWTSDVFGVVTKIED